MRLTLAALACQADLLMERSELDLGLPPKETVGVDFGGLNVVVENHTVVLHPEQRVKLKHFLDMIPLDV